MKKFLAILLSVCTLCACTPKEPVSNDNVAGNEEQQIEEKVRTIAKSEEANDFSKFELLGQYTALVDGIEEEVCFNLFTSAQRDKTGELMWDDTQEWILTADTAFGRYILFDERINGHAYMKVLKSYNENSEATIINLHIYANTYNEIREYRFNKDVFEERKLFTTDDNSTQGISELYSTIPEYE